MKYINVRAKALSFLLSAVLLLPAVSLPLVPASALGGSLPETSASAASQIVVYNDTLDCDITDDPNVYLDNSSVLGGITKTTITVSLADSSGDTSVTGDAIQYEVTNDTSSVEIEDVTPEGVTTSKTLVLRGYSGGDNSPYPRNPGTASLRFTNKFGSVKMERTVVVTVFRPSTDMIVYWNGGMDQLLLNDYSPDNETEVSAVVGHSYELFTELLPAESTDDVVWNVYDGFVSGGQGDPTDKASVEDSVFTAYSEGEVTLCAEFAEAPTLRTKLPEGSKLLFDEETSEEKEVVVPTMPKYIYVDIVKENPATAVRFTSVPTELTVGDTFQVEYETDAAYSGDGYDGATDEMHWESSDERVLTVSDDGFLYAEGKGKAVLTLCGESADVTASVEINVVLNATDIKVSSSAETRVGVSTEVTAELTPSDANERLLWIVENPSIASVKPMNSGEGMSDTKAVITGLSEGTTNVTVTSVNSKMTKSIRLKVGPRKEADSVSLQYKHNKGDKDSVGIGDGSTIDLFTKNQIRIEGLLKTADGSVPDDKIVWDVTNSNDCVSVVESDDSSITILGSSSGTAVIKAHAALDPSVSATFYVQVLRSAESISFFEEDGETSLPSGISMSSGTTQKLVAKPVVSGSDPGQHDDYIIGIESDNADAVSVDDEGNLTAAAVGKANIKATTASGLSRNVTVTVFTPSSVTITGVSSVEGSTLPAAEIRLDSGGSGKTNIGVVVKDGYGENVGNANVVWKSSDESVVTADRNGCLRAAGLGTATITASCGSKSDQCKAIVYAELSDVAIENPADEVFSPVKKSYEPEPKLTFAGNELKKGVDYTLTYQDNTGGVKTNAKITVNGAGSFRGTRDIYFKITAKPLTDPEVAYIEIPRADYSGKAITPRSDITCSQVLLTEGVDYSISYSDNIDPGTGKVIVSGIGNYTGSIEIPFEIYCDHVFETAPEVVKEPTCAEPGIKKGYCTVCHHNVEVEIPALPHTFGDPRTIAPTTTSEGYDLHTCEVCGFTYKDNFVERLPGIKISECTASISGRNFPYEGKPVEPEVTLTHNGMTLTENTDYTLTYLNNTAVGTGYILITGMGDYSGMGKITFNITNGVSDADTSTPKTVDIELTELDEETDANDGRISIANDEVQILNPVTYSPLNAPYTPKPSASADGIALIEGVDYIITYANNEKVGTASITMTGIGKYKGTAKFQFDILPRSFRDGTIVVRSLPAQKCTGSPLTPSPIVLFSNVILSNGTDYTVTYKNNTKPGMATATITGIGNYSDSLELNFEIDCEHSFEEVFIPGDGINPGHAVRRCSICGETDKGSAGMLGDVSGDGTIAADDALLALRYTVGLTQLDGVQLLVADVDSDGSVTANDSLSILRYTVGLEPSDSPIGKTASASYVQ